MNRFIVIVLDSFGIGYMDDAKLVRPQDVGANTCKHILEKKPELKLENLEKLGMMNALGEEVGCMKKSESALYGKAALMHFGADTFYGHQEIMGTKPEKPVYEAFSKSIDKVYEALVEEGYTVEYRGDNVKFLLVDSCVTVADNIEADPGQAYNVTATLDLISYDEVIKIGKIVRKCVKVSRVIAFGGENVLISDIINAVEEKEGKYVGINAPKSGVYNKGYKVIHLGYGIDPKVQIPTILGKKGINVSLFGKVADIVFNDYGKSVPGVDTKEVLIKTVEELEIMNKGFICTNVQETDLAGHGENVEKYAEKLQIADKYIGEIMRKMNGNDILVVMADHGNDPTIGHSHHTREYVPLLIYGSNLTKGYIGKKNTLSDVGATVAEYFNIDFIQNGKSFLKDILDK